MVNDENDPPLVSTKNVWMLRDLGGSDKDWKGKLEASSGCAMPGIYVLVYSVGCHDRWAAPVCIQQDQEV